MPEIMFIAHNTLYLAEAPHDLLDPGHRLITNLQNHFSAQNALTYVEGTHDSMETRLKALHDSGQLSGLEGVVFADAHSPVTDTFDTAVAALASGHLWAQRLKRVAFVHASWALTRMRPFTFGRDVDRQGPLLRGYDLLICFTSSMIAHLYRNYEFPNTIIIQAPLETLLYTETKYTEVTDTPRTPLTYRIAWTDMPSDATGYDQFLALMKGFNELELYDYGLDGLTVEIGILCPKLGEGRELALPELGNVVKDVKVYDYPNLNGAAGYYCHLLGWSNVVISMNSVFSVNLSILDAWWLDKAVIAPDRNVDAEPRGQSYDIRQRLRDDVLNGYLEYLSPTSMLPVDSRTDLYLNPVILSNPVPKNFAPILLNMIDAQAPVYHDSEYLRIDTAQRVFDACDRVQKIIANVVTQRLI